MSWDLLWLLLLYPACWLHTLAPLPWAHGGIPETRAGKVWWIAVFPTLVVAAVMLSVVTSR